MQQIYHRTKSPEIGPNSFEGLSTRTGASMECDIFLADNDAVFAVVHNKDLVDSEGSILTQEHVESLGLTALTEMQGDNDSYENRATPELEEALWLALDRGNQMYLELKASSPEQAEKLADRLADKLQEFIALAKQDGVSRGYTEAEMQDLLNGSIVVSSFSVDALKHFNARKEQAQGALGAVDTSLFWTSEPNRDDEMEISKTMYGYLGINDEDRGNLAPGDEWLLMGAELANKIGCDSIAIYHSSITSPEVVDAVHEKGVKLIAFAADNEEVYKTMQEYGVDAAMTEQH